MALREADVFVARCCAFKQSFALLANWIARISRCSDRREHSWGCDGRAPAGLLGGWFRVTAERWRAVSAHAKGQVASSRLGRFIERVVRMVQGLFVSGVPDPWFVGLRGRSLFASSRGIRLGAMSGTLRGRAERGFVSAGGSGLLVMVAFTSGRVQGCSASLRTFASRKPVGLDSSLREVVMRGRRPLSACGKEPSHVHVHHVRPAPQPRSESVVLAEPRSSRSRCCRYYTADPLRRRSVPPVPTWMRHRPIV